MAKSNTKHQQIFEYVRDRIISGEYGVGDRLPSDGQLVKLFSTSRPTVAKAMHDLEAEGYLERRIGAGSFVRMQEGSKPALIGMLTPEVAKHELFEPICNEIASQCRKHKLSLLRSDWFDVELNEEQQEQRAVELCEKYIQLGVAGVFFAPVEFSEQMKKVNREIAHRLTEAGISVVLLDRDLERTPDRSQYDLISVDNFRIGLIQANHLIKLGEKRIAYVTREASAPTIAMRIAGYRYALDESGDQTDSPIVLIGDPNSVEFVNKIRQIGPTAIVCSNDTTAFYLLRSLQAAGVRVPEDIKLVGVDDVKIASEASVPFTTIRQPCREMGVVAVRTMTRRIENRKMVACTYCLDVELVVRESCGAGLK
jgi:LacI family transcriptional regulator